MKVITTHTNADFDSLSSMLAAKKIYEDAILVFPGSQEKSLRDFLIKSTVYVFDIVKVKDVDLDKIDTLILVDTRQKSRIGDFSKIIGREGLEIHIYDHHPPTDDDIKGDLEFIENYGATVTILVQILKEKGIEITPDEATVMMLGIYEETGNFTYPSTKVEDFLAASYLLSKGANLNVVSDMLVKELTVEQVLLLNELIRNAVTYNINGVDVVITESLSSHYVGEVAPIVQRFRDMENLNVVFAILGMDDRVFVVARSRIPEVDVGHILSFLGGGGHREAASATLKEKTVPEVKEELISILRTHIKRTIRAKDIMFFPVKTVSPGEKIEDAREIMVKYNINSLPVTQDGKVLGIVTRQIAEKAIFHDLGNLPVTDYMMSDIRTLKEDDSIDVVKELMASSNQRFIPVLRNGKLIGGITRSDLLRIIGTEKKEISEHPHFERKRNLRHLMEERLKKDVLKKLKEIGEISERLNYHAYLVGGFVRDLLLGKENYDLDVVVEGDGIKLARELSKVYGLKIVEHREFGTAKVFYKDGVIVDIATSRIEYYEEPGSLPVVEKGSLKLDLSRRDFTINTLAISLNKNTFGELIDFFGGQRDLKERTLRVLHSLSFVEDPTRILRALRFEGRFGFRISKHTLNLMKNALRMGFLTKVEGRRIWNELKLILLEKNPETILKRMDELGVLSQIYEKLRFDEEMASIFSEIRGVKSWYELLFKERPFDKVRLYLLCLLKDFTSSDIDQFLQKMELKERERRKIKADLEMLRELRPKLSMIKNAKKSEVYRLLKDLSTEAILLLMAETKDEELRRSISNFVTTSSTVKPEISGKDLKALGFKEGPIFKEILEKLRDLRIDGLVKTKEDEINFVLANFGRDG